MPATRAGGAAVTTAPEHLTARPTRARSLRRNRIRAASTQAAGTAPARAVAAAEHLVDVMGTRAHVIVHARELDLADVLARAAIARLHALAAPWARRGPLPPARPPRAAIARLHVLEARWSRFRPDSEVTALNRSAGAPTSVSA